MKQLSREKSKCEACGKDAVIFATFCGCKVCDVCEKHQGLVRCYCGWSLSGRDGRRELEEMGEVIDDEY